MENQKSNSTFSAILLSFTLMVAALWVSPAAVAAEKETVFDPATGKTWTAPEYGGTLTWATRNFPKSTDVWSAGGWAPHFISAVIEKMVIGDWALPRETHGTLNWEYTGPEMYRGGLAESWSMPDDTTFIWNIRQGVHFHDKPPVNGREFDAHDVVWNFHRYYGLGDFAEAGSSPQRGIVGNLEFLSVTATDKWTVELKLTKPQVNVVSQLLHNMIWMYPPEVFEEEGGFEDWRNLVGTGPYRLTDHVEGSSATWEKNPNYWGVDEKFGNRLPYIDELRALMMPDASTRLAALRTGRIDILTNTGDAHITNIDNLESLQKSNPELEVWPQYSFIPGTFVFNQSLPPMQDVDVRKALQMSVDREAITATFFKDWADPAPYGIFHHSTKGFVWPYEEWPDEVKREYEYRPDDAEALLDAAGYPRGADGYRFKITVGNLVRYDPTYAEILMGYFDAIGVDSELSIFSEAEGGAAFRADTAEWELMNAGYGVYRATPRTIGEAVQNIDSSSATKVDDPRMEALYYAAVEATDLEEYKSYHRQADEISIREHYGLVKPRSAIFSVSQPWVEGFAGEFGLGYTERHTHFSRVWIDSEVKEAMMGN